MRNPLSKKVIEIQPSGIRKFFDIVSEMKGKKIKISTRTTNRIIAEAMRQKISDLEAAYMCGLSLDECGLSEWCNLFSKHNPDAYNTLERSGLVFSAKDNEKSIEISSLEYNRFGISYGCQG